MSYTWMVLPLARNQLPDWKGSDWKWNWNTDEEDDIKYNYPLYKFEYERIGEYRGIGGIYMHNEHTFELTYPDAGGVLCGGIFVKPPQQNSIRVDYPGAQYSNYVELYESVCGSYMPSFSHLGNELISHNQIKELVIDENPSMVSFSKAVNESFQNGYAKSYWFLRSGESITESENSSTHYAFGNCCCDLMTLSAISHSPLVIFECKSNKNTSERAQGMVQVVSHG